MCDLDKKFNEIAVENFKIKLNCEECPDQFIGTVEYNGTNFQWKEKKVVILNDKGKKLKGKELKTEREKYNEEIKNLPIITIVLESPHKDEYYLDLENNKIEPIGPACGNTGKNINDFICGIFSGKYMRELKDGRKLEVKGEKLEVEEGTYRIRLVNAIKFQCSLGQSTGFCRTENFLGCWQGDFSEDFKGDFKERLLKYKPNVIINCCTLGGKNLRRKVQIEINNVSDGITLYECNHPSSWGWKDAVLKKPKPPKKLKSKQKSAL